MVNRPADDHSDRNCEQEELITRERGNSEPGERAKHRGDEAASQGASEPSNGTGTVSGRGRVYA